MRYFLLNFVISWARLSGGNFTFSWLYQKRKRFGKGISVGQIGRIGNFSFDGEFSTHLQSLVRS